MIATHPFPDHVHHAEEAILNLKNIAVGATREPSKWFLHVDTDPSLPVPGLPSGALLVYSLDARSRDDARDQAQEILLGLDRGGAMKAVAIRLVEVADTVTLPIAHWREDEADRLQMERSMIAFVRSAGFEAIMRHEFARADGEDER